MTTLRLGTRGTILALAQATHVADALHTAHPRLRVQLVTIPTHGDRWADNLGAGTGIKGAYIREIDQQLADGAIDLAVHCLKDRPSHAAEHHGVVLAAHLRRDEPRDALVTATGSTLALLPPASVVGTSAPRRQAQLRRHRPALRIKPVRGSIEARLQRVDSGELDAVIVSAAALHRTGQADRITELLPLDSHLPAAGAAVLAVTARPGDERTRDLVAVLDHPDTATAATAERAYLRRLGATCRSSIAAHATVAEDMVTLRASVYSPSGDRVLHTVVGGAVSQARKVGRDAAEQLLALGARKLLNTDTA
ncbi:hydroxymethylbilane synthase [Catellatospora chokoriensis]|uniref:hydroxymethylbilane synthase n=1 Tax=Catellatospora chokoriensis TaxID=310353 RepID=UPI001780D580|nr:hydroxymethylbilane synthase [Catellatospora chokoriensis]